MDSADASSRYDDGLGRLAEYLAQKPPTEEVDAAVLAARCSVTIEDVRNCVAALAAVESALGEDFPAASGVSFAAGAEAPELPADYEVLGEIGRGGMGIVFKATQRSLGRTVAVKVLRPAELIFGKALQRFEREARSLAKLRHPHIVAIHEVGKSAGNLFYIMDLIEGSPLAAILRNGAINASRAVRILTQVASAIEYAHKNDIVHRDLKPSNILIDARGEAFVADFGLARDAAFKEDLTVSGHLLGTPAYMSPEQARGDTALIGERTDIYALGAILYECLTGHRPFDKRSLVETIYDVIHREPAAPRALNRLIPLDLEIICRKAMAKEPERRYGTVRAFLEDLERFEEGRPIRARRPTVAYRLSRWTVRNWVPVTAAAAAAVGVSALYLTLVLSAFRASPTALQYYAREAHARGEFDEAVDLYRSAIRRLPRGRDNKDYALAVELHEERIKSLRARIEQLDRSESFGEALRRYQELERDAIGFFGQMFEEKIRDVRWKGAQLLLRDGDHVKAFELFGTLWHSLTPTELDVLLAPAGREASHAGHQLAVNLADYLLFNVWNQSWQDVLARLVRCSPDGKAAVRNVLLLSLERYLAQGRDREPKIRHSPWSRRPRQGFKDAHALEEPLAEIAAMNDVSPELRSLAVDWLAAVADLPLEAERQPPYQGGRYNPFPCRTPKLEAEILQVWSQLHAKDRKGRYHGLVAWAVKKFLGPKEELLGASERTLAKWIETHTGLSGVDEASVRRWWERHANDDPVAYLSEALGLPPEGDLLSVFNVFLRTRFGNESERRDLLLKLLRLSAPPEILAEVKESTDTMVWYEAIKPPDEPYRLRVARIDCPLTTSVPQVAWEQMREVRIGETAEIEWHEQWDHYGYLNIDVRVPGVPEKARKAPDRVRRMKQPIRVVWARGRVAVDSSDPFEVGVVNGPSLGYRHRERDWRDPPAEMFVVLEPAGADGRAWSADDWRAAIARNLAFLVEGIEKERASSRTGVDDFRMRYMNNLNWLLHYSDAFLPLPGCRRELAALAGRFRNETDPQLLRARLLAGDTTLLDDPELRVFLEQSTRDQDPTFAVRLLLSTEIEEFRAFASSALGSYERFPSTLAAPLELAIAHGKLTPSASLLEKLAKAQAQAADERARAKPWYFTHPVVLWIGAVLGFGILYTLVRALWPFRPRTRRYSYAAGLILIGTIFAIFDYPWRYWNLLPAEGGYALMAVGALVFARGSGKKAFLLVPLGFVVALAFALLARRTESHAVVSQMSGLAATAALSFLPFLFRVAAVASLEKLGAHAAHILESLRARIGSFIILYAIPMALYHLCRLGSLFFDLEPASRIPVPLYNIQDLIAFSAMAALLALLLFPFQKDVCRAWRA